MRPAANRLPGDSRTAAEVPRDRPRVRGGLAITKKLIRGRTVIKTNCTAPNPPRIRNECSTWKPYGGWWKQNFTITINLTHTRIGGRGGGEN